MIEKFLQQNSVILAAYLLRLKKDKYAPQFEEDSVYKFYCELIASFFDLGPNQNDVVKKLAEKSILKYCLENHLEYDSKKFIISINNALDGDLLLSILFLYDYTQADSEEDLRSKYFVLESSTSEAARFLIKIENTTYRVFISKNFLNFSGESSVTKIEQLDPDVAVTSIEI
jgi:hypothetical protein